MSNLQEEQQPIDSRIVYELIGVIPNHWSSAALQIEHFSNDRGSERYSHTIKSLEGFKETVFPSDELYIATKELYLVFKKHGFHWKKVTYQILLSPDGDWMYKANFEY